MALWGRALCVLLAVGFCVVGGGKTGAPRRSMAAGSGGGAETPDGGRGAAGAATAEMDFPEEDYAKGFAMVREGRGEAVDADGDANGDGVGNAASVLMGADPVSANAAGRGFEVGGGSLRAWEIVPAACGHADGGEAGTVMTIPGRSVAIPLYGIRKTLRMPTKTEAAEAVEAQGLLCAALAALSVRPEEAGMIVRETSGTVGGAGAPSPRIFPLSPPCVFDEAHAFMRKTANGVMKVELRAVRAGTAEAVGRLHSFAAARGGTVGRAVAEACLQLERGAAAAEAECADMRVKIALEVVRSAEGRDEFRAAIAPRAAADGHDVQVEFEP